VDTTESNAKNKSPSQIHRDRVVSHGGVGLCIGFSTFYSSACTRSHCVAGGDRMLVFWSMAALDDYRLLVASSFSCSPYVSKYGHKGRFLFGYSWRCWPRTFSVSVRQLYAKPTRELIA